MYKATATLEILDEVNVRFRRIDSGTLAQCSNRLAFYTPNYRFQPNYKLGRWDGKIRLFQVKGGGVSATTYLSCLDEVLPIIEEKYNLEIIDHRPDHQSLIDQIDFVDENLFSHLVWPEGHDRAGEPIILRDYQIAAANACIASGSGIMQLGTAGGKSLLCAALANQYLKVGNVVVIVPSIDLVIQTRKTFRWAGIDCGIWYGEEKERRACTMATWQSTNNFLELFEGTNAFIIDECQGVKGKVLNEMLSGPAAHVPFRFACTGTLPPEELFKRQIIGVVGPTVFTKTIKEMQDEGYLSQGAIQQIMFNDRANPSYVKAVGGTTKLHGHAEYRDEIIWMHNEPARMQFLRDLIDGLRSDGKTLVLVQHHDYHTKLVEMFPEAISVTGKIHIKKRDPLWEAFRSDNDLAIVTSGVGSTGIDVPNIRYVVGIEMGKSLIKIMQSLGRGLRKTSTKNWLDFIDLCGNAKLSERHANERKKLFEYAGQTVTRIQVDY